MYSRVANVTTDNGASKDPLQVCDKVVPQGNILTLDLISLTFKQMIMNLIIFMGNFGKFPTKVFVERIPPRR
jgi:hypothetical protein